MGTFAALAVPASAGAATIDVEIRTDELNNDGDCSLREAAQAANVDGVGQLEAGCTAGSGADIIDLDTGSPYTLTTPFDINTPDIDDGDLELTDPDGVSLVGEGRATTIVDGGDNDRIFNAIAGDLIINAATVRNGLVAGGRLGGGIISQGGDVTLVAAGVIENLQLNAMGNGGGIALLDEAALTASGETVINDNIAAGNGGGIFKIDDGDITLNPGVEVDGNQGVGFGGGVYAVGNLIALTLDGARVADNTLTEDATQFAWGSGVYFSAVSAFDIIDSEITSNDAIGDRAIAALDMFSSAASMIDDSTISGNTVTGQDDADPPFDVLGPAGIRFNVNPGVTISDSTISQNTVTGVDPDDTTNGAGIYPLGPLTITGSTIAQNSIGGVGPTLAGGGLYLESSTFTSVGILNSTLVGNSAAGLGGAINLQSNGHLTIAQSTFSGNVSPQGPSINSQGGASTMLILRGSIFDNGMGACFSGIPSGLVANSFNVDAGTSCIEAADDTDFENTDADLDGLDDNGGPTETMQLLGPANLFNGAAACTQADGVTPLLVDQRGFARPSEGACEPGAYERFICNGVELMQPGPFPGCPAPPGPGGTTPINPTTSAPAPAAKKKCKKRKKKGGAAAKKKCKRKKP